MTSSQSNSPQDASLETRVTCILNAAFSGLPFLVCPWLIGTEDRLLFEANYVTDKQKLYVRELGDV